MLSWLETKDVVSSPSAPSAETCCHVPPPPLPIAHPALAPTAQLCHHQRHRAQTCIMSPSSNSKPRIKFITWGIWARLSQARTSTTMSSAVGAGHFLQGGEELHKWQEIAGEVVVNSWEGKKGKKGGGIWEKGQRLMKQLSQCYFCPGRAMAAARPVSAKGQGSILFAQRT